MTNELAHIVAIVFSTTSVLFVVAFMQDGPKKVRRLNMDGKLLVCQQNDFHLKRRFLNGETKNL